MDGKKIIVGIVGDGVDSEVLKIAAAHEYGTDKLPERSFIRASFDADQDKLGSIVSGQVNKVLSGQTSADAAANAIGAQAAQLVQNFIDENRVKPQSDFSKKTQHTTLYETGTHIRDRIAFKVEEE
nr:MAG TPA: virion morphogenesis protein [Caudoviricetes sp.]